MSLRLRISITYAVVVALVVAVLGAVLYATMQRSVASEMDTRLFVRAEEVQQAMWPQPADLANADLSRLDLTPISRLEAPGRYIQVADASGRLVASSENRRGDPIEVDPSDLQRALAGRPVLVDVLDGSRPLRLLLSPLTVNGRTVGVLEVTQSSEPLREAMAGLQRVLGLIGVTALLLAALVGWLVGYRGLRPLAAISDQAAAIGESRDFSLRLPRLARRDEIGRLTEVIDDLLAKVEETLKAHRDFLADTSHELRNPLLAIRTNLELVGRVKDQAGRDECVREALGQVQRVSRLVSDLLMLAQVEHGLVLERRPVDLQDVAERAMREAGSRAAGQNLTIKAPEPVTVMGDEARLGQILANLLDNAIKHTPAGGRITVKLASEVDGAWLHVEDTGAGIAAADLPRLFDRGFRGAGADEGYGFGLAIVKYLTEAHGGRVTVESEVGRGSCFGVWLPREGASLPPSASSSSASAPSSPPRRRPSRVRGVRAPVAASPQSLQP